MYISENTISYLFIWLVFFIFSLGIVTNTLNLVVLSRKSMKSTTNRYLFALAICDIFVLIFSALSLSNSFAYDFSMSTDSFISSFEARMIEPSDETFLSSTYILNNETNSIFVRQNSEKFSIKTLYYDWVMCIYPTIYPYVYPLAIMFQFCTVWINLGMSADRFIAINFPFKSFKYCTVKKAKKIIFIIFLVSIVYSLPRFFEYYVHMEKLSINDNQTITYAQYDLSKFGKSRLYRQVVYFWMYIIFQSVIPSIILIILNMGLIMSLKESHRYVLKFYDNRKNRSLKLNRNDIRFTNSRIKCKEITIMLIFLVVLFIVLHSPSVVCNSVYGYNHLSQSNSFDLNKICHIGNFFIITSSSTNFFTYFLFNRRFRKELLILCRCYTHIEVNRFIFY
jgi:hypothetical protein